MPAIARIQNAKITDDDKYRRKSAIANNINRVTAKIILQEFQDDCNHMLLGIKFNASNTITKKTASEILKNKNLFYRLSKKDAEMILYLAAEEY